MSTDIQANQRRTDPAQRSAGEGDPSTSRKPRQPANKRAERQCCAPNPRALPLVLAQITLIVIISGFFFTPFASAQDWRDQIEQLAIDEGLLLNTVIGIVQDHHGFIWIAGTNALLRYDGYHFLRIPEDSKDTLFSRWDYRGLAGGRHGILCLFGSGDEVMLYDIDHAVARLHRLIPPASTEAVRLHISCALEDSHGRFWIGTKEGVVCRINPGGLPAAQEDRDAIVAYRACNLPVNALIEDSKGIIWLARTGGIQRVASVRDETHPWDAGSGRGRVIRLDSLGAVSARKDGKLWAGRMNGELGIWDPDDGSFSLCGRMKDLGPFPYFVSMQEDSLRNVWIATLSDALHRWKPGDKITERALSRVSDTLAHNVQIECTCVDRSGLLWIGTRHAGLLTYAPWRRKFHSCTPSGGELAGLSGSFVSTAVRDRKDTLWVGTFGGGLNCLGPGSKRFLQIGMDSLDQRGHLARYLICIRERRNGDLWIANGSLGISKYLRASGTFAPVQHDPQDPESLPCDTVNAIFEERNGTVWVGHPLGVDRCDDTQGRFRPVIRWPRESLFLVGTAGYFYEDRGGNLWIGTYGRGLICLAPNRKDTVWYRKSMDVPGGLPDNTVSTICEDREGRLWMGTPAGISQFDAASRTFRTIPIQFPSPGISLQPGTPTSAVAGVGVLGIVPDDHGNLWLSTTRGIAKYNIASGQSRTFTREDGVAFTQGMRHAMFSTPQGFIYCGGIGGLSWFHPDSIADNVVQPPIVITDFRIFEDRMQLSATNPEQITLDHSQNTFAFEFAALDYTAPARNQFMYMLEGADRNWVSAGRNRKVTYANVGPGRYILRVRGSNSDGVWNEAGIAISILVKPPYWQTWWFRTVLVLVLGLLVYAAFRYRLSKLMAVENLRLRIAQDLHDDIGSSLSGIALTSEQLASRLTGDQHAENDLRELAALAIDKAESLRDLVWTVNPQKDSTGDMIFYLKETAYRVLRGLDVEFRGPQAHIGVKMTLEVKHNVTMIYREILHNIQSHSHARRVEICVTEEGGLLRLRVGDNGIGFDPGTCIRGNGLTNLEQRSRAIGGKLSIETAPGEGTVVVLEVKIT